MRFKKIYIEITNICNLKCTFCIQNSRKKRIMTFDEFKIVLDKIKGCTKYLYLHILGEPLMHPDIIKFIDYASKNFFINITTNGYLINKIKDVKKIRQINISLHSFDEKYNIPLEEYLLNIFNICDILSKYTYISYRLWVKTPYYEQIKSFIHKYYQIDTNILKKNIFISYSDMFFWPNINDNYNYQGKCYGLIDHIGVLVDGTVVPCCLDTKGDINLGNIYKDNLEDVLNKERTKKIIQGFKNNKRIEKLCQNCQFKCQLPKITKY